jgi:3-hydroxyisobutyrate dehydrogenase-like beta-hydroxyacid dehydrogenase
MVDQLSVGVFGGLGSMASPMARHWSPSSPVRVVCVHDRNGSGVQRERRREAWRQHGASLVPTVSEVLAPPELDGVFVCCGKNGDDLALIAEIAGMLSSKLRRQFLCHMSTVTAGFAAAATEFCNSLGVDYVNYPLTGGPAGAEKGTMLILASGSREVFEHLSPSLSLIGVPRYFGNSASAAAEVKLMGQAMVFNGLIGICSAAALYAECFQGGAVGGPEQSTFFDFLNTGAGGTRQWDVALSNGVRSDVWDAGFLISYAAIDAIYAADLCLKRGVSAIAVRPLVDVALAFSFVLNTVGQQFATHVIVREMVSQRAHELDSFIARHSGSTRDLGELIQRCVESLPEELQQKVALDITASDFSKSTLPS